MDVTVLCQQNADGKLDVQIGRPFRYIVEITNTTERRLEVPSEKVYLVGIVTGPWALPDLRPALAPGGFNALDPAASMRCERTLEVLYPQIEQLEVRFTSPRIDRATDAWVGDLRVAKDVKVDEMQEPEVRRKYERAKVWVRAYGKQEPLPEGYSPWAVYDFTEDYVNLEEHGGALALIDSVAKDSNFYSVKWLWDCFRETGRDSPAHVACMLRLSGLLAQGIGAEHIDDFLAVAQAPTQKEATVVRLCAIEALALLSRGGKAQDVLLRCRAKGNFFGTFVTGEPKARALAAIEQLTKDEDQQVRSRAERALRRTVLEHSGEPPR
jgi:hypothetical protein